MKLKKKTLQIANYQKQILINDIEGRTNISSLSVYEKRFHKIILIEKVTEECVAKTVRKRYYRSAIGS